MQSKSTKRPVKTQLVELGPKSIAILDAVVAALAANQPITAAVAAAPEIIDGYEIILSGKAAKELSTGLIWSREEFDSMNHAAALKHCAALNKSLPIDGYEWDLPTSKELFTQTDQDKVSPAANVKVYPSVKSSYYWTKTIYPGSSGCARIVGFGNGFSSWSSRSNNLCVRAVARPRQGN